MDMETRAAIAALSETMNAGFVRMGRHFELRELRGRSGQTEELRREISELGMRVERLERRQSD